jgi:hypothetical protein
MCSDPFPTFANLALLSLGLLSCIGRPEPQLQAALGRTALYEQQVEEGFGRLDKLPANWSMVPR